jgi:uncharacterized protein
MMSAGKPSTPLRWLVAALIVILLGGLAITLVQLTDTALSIQERLARLPGWLAWPLAALLIGIGLALVWLVWRVLRPAARALPVPKAVTLASVRERAQNLAKTQLKTTNKAAPKSMSVARNSAAVDAPPEPLPEPLSEPLPEPVPGLETELVELQARKATGQLYLALFGEISTGKSSLIRALTGASSVESDVLGGTTKQAALFEAKFGPELTLMLSDVPGTNEASDLHAPGGQSRAVLAREEALRAHVVALVVTGDLSRAEALEWQWLQQFGKPVWLILNMSDRFSADELRSLSEGLQRKFGAAPIVASSGGTQSIEVELPDGSRQQRSRSRTPQIQALREALLGLARTRMGGVEKLEQKREQAVLMALDLKLSAAEKQARLQQGQKIVKTYTRRALLGAMAAVAPGTDLVIQGALAIALVKELTNLYQVPLRQVEIDDLLKLMGGKLKGSFAVLFAIAGNAAKAFPGVGTLGGGALHAVAYGVLFESLGDALLECLDRAEPGGLDRTALLDRLRLELDNPAIVLQRAQQMLKALSR